MDSLFNLLLKQITFIGNYTLREGEVLWKKDPAPPVRVKHVMAHLNPESKILTVKKPKLSIELEEKNVSQYGNEFIIKLEVEDEEKGEGILKFKVKRLYI